MPAPRWIVIAGPNGAGKTTFARASLRCVAARVRQGGHNVPEEDIIRRFERGWKNFQEIDRPLADTRSVYACSGDRPILTDQHHAS
jgi:predicted ABC-type ATPase